MNMDYKKIELADGYLSELSRNGFLELMDSMYEKGFITSDDEVYDSFGSSYVDHMRKVEPEGLVETSPVLTNPKEKKHSLSSLGEEIYEVVQEYRPEIDGFGDVLESFKLRKSVNWTEFLSEAEEDDIVMDMVDDVDSNTRLHYIDEADELGLLESEKSGGKWSISNVTEKGEAVQEFIEEIGETVYDELDEQDSSPTWEL